VAKIFQVDENDIPWAEYADAAEGQESVTVRYKALTARGGDTPPMQYVDYAPGHVDPVHSHNTGEVLIITRGELQLSETVSGPGSAVFIPRNTEYSIRSGAEGVRFFRIVVP
jgi:quercetin dioxygenase-like cupin family protein